VTYDKLFAYLVADIGKSERTGFLFYSAMENDLKQNIAKFFTKKLGIFKINSLVFSYGFFNEIAFYGFVSLFTIPRTSALASEKSDDINKIINRIIRFLLEFNHTKTLPFKTG